MRLPFTEKYRPNTLDDIIGNNEIIRCLKSFDSTNIPNLLFCGPSGTGKTTSVRCLLKNICCSKVIELNASDERGINVVRSKIKEFASTVEKNFIILDEVDSMSKDAQEALRRIIEDFSDRSRFCLICNYERKIIEPIKSRCVKFRFLPVVDKSRISDICCKEGLLFDDAGIDMLIKYADGDFRKLINDLEGIYNTHKKISVTTVSEFLGLPLLHDKNVEKIYKTIFDVDVPVAECLTLFEGINATLEDILPLISENIISDAKILNKLEYLRILGQIEERLAIGCSEKVQTLSMISIFRKTKFSKKESL